ncbi:MAG: porin family protein [Bacteroidales bacterium]|jgi:hypothetical protein|nr:porin family protein [Bacteroidales bacterium]
MIRNLLITLLLLGLASGLSGQDRIITLNNDTINCRIRKVTRNDISFDVITSGITTSGNLRLAEIRSYSISTATGRSQDFKPVSGRTSGNLRLALNGGMGYIISSSEKAEESMAQLGITESNARAYYNDLKSGWYGGADAAWLFHRTYGAGVRYKFFNTVAATEGEIDLPGEYNIFFSEYRENIFVNYAGVLLFYRQPHSYYERFSLYGCISMGMAFYSNQMEFLSEYFLVTGEALGFDGGIGFEYEITPYISAGAEVSLFNAIIKEIDITNGVIDETQELDKENYENLSRAELSVGIRFYF